VRVYAADWVLPVAGPPIENGGVAVENGLIAAVGPAETLEGERETFREAVICPGFVNAHSHLEYAVHAGFGDGLGFREWLELHVARGRALELSDRVDIARLGAAECLASGVTTVGDASFSGAAATAADELGLRAVVYLEVFGEGTAHMSERFEANRERIAGSLSERVRLGVSPHAPYTASLELYRACADTGLPLSTHLAESAAERDWVVSGSGPWAESPGLLVPPLGETGIRALARAGLLSSRMVAAHCVTVDDEEIELLAEHGVAVAHCPRSNAYLGCGIAPVRRLLDAGVRVGLGTDSPASAGSFDMFEEMRTAISMARSARADAGSLSCADALRLATLGGAEALGLHPETGSLEPGKRADLTVVSLAESVFLPWEDPVSAVVLGGAPGRILRTIVDGEPRYVKGGERWHELRQNAQSARARMLATRSGP
jgi:5-methylthioadenosine/S-adenosylhomocysteine deaminase